MVKPAKKTTAEEADKRILEYMRRANRPYSAVDVFNNMKQEIGKTQVQKSLLQLVEEGHLSMKLNGKQQAFVIRQDTMEEVSQEELAQMDDAISVLKQSVQEKKDLVRQLSSRLATLLSSLTDEQIHDRLEGLAKQNEKNTEKLKLLREGGVMISDEERKAIDLKYEESRKQWRLRKRIFKDVIETITEPMEMKPRVLMEELGLEADEDVGHDYNKDYTAYLSTE